MKQSYDNHFLKIDITHIIEVFITSRIVKDMTVSCINIEFSSRVLLSSLDFRKD